MKPRLRVQHKPHWSVAVSLSVRSVAIANPAQLIARDLLHLGGLLGAERAPPCSWFEGAGGVRVTQGDGRDPGADEFRHRARGGFRLAHKLLVAKRGQPL